MPVFSCTAKCSWTNHCMHVVLLRTGELDTKHVRVIASHGLSFGVWTTSASFVIFHESSVPSPSIVIEAISEGYRPVHVLPLGTRLLIAAVSPGHARIVAYRMLSLAVKRMSSGV